MTICYYIFSFTKLLKAKLLLLLFSCVLFAQPNNNECINRQISNLLENSENESVDIKIKHIKCELESSKCKRFISVTQDTTPYLYNFLIPPIQQLCKIAGTLSVPCIKICVENASEIMAIESDEFSIFLGKEFLKLFLYDSRYTPYLFSLIAHELWHIHYDTPEKKPSANNELLADEFAVRITQGKKQFETALMLATISLNLFFAITNIGRKNCISQLFTNKEIASITRKTAFHMLTIIQKGTCKEFIDVQYDSNLLLSTFFTKALQKIPLEITPPDSFADKLIKSIDQLYSEKKLIKEMCNKTLFNATNKSTHPPLAERIRRIQELKL
jgi:hypothetical protein